MQRRKAYERDQLLAQSRATPRMLKTIFAKVGISVYVRRVSLRLPWDVGGCHAEEGGI